MRTLPTESVDWNLCRLTETREPVGVCLGPLHIYIMAEWFSVLVGFLTVEEEAVSDSCLLMEPFPSYWVALSSLDVVLLCPVTPCLVDVPGKPALS